MQKVIDLAKDYANRFQDCFTQESSDSWISRFSINRLDNTIEDFELEERDRNNEEYRVLFTKEFIKETRRILETKNVKVDDTGKKTKLVKRKKD